MALKFYQILDVGLALNSDFPEFLAMFHQDYSWFATSSLQGPRRLSFSLERQQGSGPYLQINDQVVSLEGQPDPARYAYQLMHRLLFKETRDYFLLHAAVVAREGQALIISGPPGAGKTTLTLSLLEAGLHFLSDDFCPIHKGTQLVYPFPRSLWVSGKGQALGQAREESPASHPRGRKFPLKPQGPEIITATSPCQAKSLIFLDPGDESPGCQELEVGLRRGGAREFLQGVRELGPVTVEPMGPESGEWRLRYPRGQGLTSRIRDFLSRYGEDVWNVFRVRGTCPDFNREPVLTPIPSHEAAFLVMGELKQELDFNGALEASGPPAVGYFMELNQLLEGTSCYRVTPGKLDTLKDLALRILGHGG